MKLVTEREPQEEVVIVTSKELQEFQRIGKLLAKVIDDKRGTGDNKVSVEADGFLRIYSWNDEVIDVTSYPGGLIDTINDLEPEDNATEDDDDLDYEEEEENPTYVYEQATELKEGVRVEATKDITCGDLFSEFDGDISESLRKFVVVPKGTMGIVTEDPWSTNTSVSVAFRDFKLPSSHPASWRTRNNLRYKTRDIEICSYSCQCPECLKMQMEEVKRYPR